MKDPLYLAIEQHWREHRPNMVKQLEAKGLLDRAIEYVADRTTHAEASLMQQGMSTQSAQEKMREEWAFLPAEQDRPELPNGSPEQWLELECNSHSASRIELTQSDASIRARA